jgi:hypothetical protein
MTEAEKKEIQALKEKVKMLERRIQILEDCQQIGRRPYIGQFLETSPIPGPGDYPWPLQVTCLTSEETKGSLRQGILDIC